MNGAGNGARTRHLSLGKAALYQMSYSRKRVWCLRVDLNHRHRDFQSLALPAELPRHKKMATRRGLEPLTSSVTGWRTNQLYYRAVINGGNNRARTCDPLLVRQVLSQLSYAPPHITNAKISIAEKGCPVNGKLTHSTQKNQEKLTSVFWFARGVFLCASLNFFNNPAIFRWFSLHVPPG